jgi:hypothetical protein
MNQMSRDIQYNLLPYHPAHTNNNIYPLAFQDDNTGQKCLANKLKWDFMGHTIGNNSTSGSGNEIWCRRSTKSKLSLFAQSRLMKSCEAPESNNIMT